jgi:alpha-D-xyloside xylohydrolase
MKFTDGYWNIREDVTLFNAVEICDANVGDSTLTVYAACKPVLHRGDTLNSPLLTFTFSSPMDDVIRVQVTTGHKQERMKPACISAAASSKYAFTKAKRGK